MIYFEMVKFKETFTANRKQLKFFNLNRALIDKWSEYAKRHDTVILHDNDIMWTSMITLDHMLGSLFNKRLNWMFYRTRCIHLTLLYLIKLFFRSIQHSLLNLHIIILKIFKKWIDDYLLIKQKTLK